MLILEDRIKPRNNGISNVYTFLYEDLESVEFYATRPYVHWTKKEREEDFFVGDEEEEDNGVLLVSESPLLVEQR